MNPALSSRGNGARIWSHRVPEETAMARRFRTSGEGAEAMTFSATMRPTAVRIAKKVSFYILPRPVQDRFVAATRRTAPPAPLLVQKAPRKTVWAYLGGSGGIALLAVLLLRAGWGDPGS